MCFPLVVEEAAQQVHLDPGYDHHDDKVGTRPQVDPVVVALLQVAVTGFEGSQ